MSDGLAASALSAHGYYRLKGYWPRRDEGGRFPEGASLSQVIRASQLDAGLRGAAWRMVCTFEVAFRARLASELALVHGPLALEDASAFADVEMWRASIGRVHVEVERGRRGGTPFVTHNLERYGALPVWATVELLSLGTLSKLYGNLADAGVASRVASGFGVSPRHLRSWSEYVTQIRNICAHQGRLYGRVFPKRPRLYREWRSLATDRAFMAFVVLLRLLRSLPGDVAADSLADLVELVDMYPDVPLASLGFGDGWERLLAGVCSNSIASVRPPLTCPHFTGD